ncbi:MAG: hypothetical protein ACREX3_10650 [Gammaproteobacteria bacterium]
MAAAFGGIGRSTLYDWLGRGARAEVDQEVPMPEEEIPFVEFFLAVQKALAEWELQQLEAIAEAGKKDWRASAWLLERRFPDQYGRLRGAR